MASLLERSIATIESRLLLLAPPQATVPDFFQCATEDAFEHERLVRDVQRLRGGIYYRDGAIQRHELSKEGLHQTAEDQKSWHLLILDEQRQVDACIWYREHENTASLEHLRVKTCPLAVNEESHHSLRAAVHNELASARQEGIRYSEVGGWAVSEKSRCTPEGLLLILGVYGLSRALGGALGVATATARHSSAAILRRLGLAPLPMGMGVEATYYDAKYNCEMELLRYDTRRSNPKYHSMIEQLKERLANVAVISPALASGIEVLEEEFAAA